MSRKFHEYFSKKMLAIMGLGFASGLPFLLSQGTLQAWFRSEGVNYKTLGILALVGAPYTLKFLWAPLMDHYLPPFLGRRRGWILICQLALCAFIAVMSFFEPSQHLWIMAYIALCISFLSASLDIVIDAYRTDSLDGDERGLGTAIHVEAYRIAIIVAGAGALIIADKYGFQKAYLLMALCLAASTLATVLAPEPELDDKTTPTALLASIKNCFMIYINQHKEWLGFLFIILIYKLGDAVSFAFTTPFLMDLGFSLTAVGTITKVVGSAAGIVGIFVGGLLMTRVSLFHALLFFGCLQAVSNLLYMALVIVGDNLSFACFVYFVENLCSGMGTTAFIAFIMTLCHPRYTATQFALFSALAAIGRVYVGPPISGFLVDNFGWFNFYIVAFCVAWPAVFLVYRMRNGIKKADQIRLAREKQSKQVPDDGHQQPAPA